MSPALDLTTPITNGVVHAHTNGLKKHIDGFGTRAVHVGSEANEETGAVIPPISLSTTYKQSAIGIHKVKCEFIEITLYKLTGCSFKGL